MRAPPAITPPRPPRRGREIGAATSSSARALFLRSFVNHSASRHPVGKAAIYAHFPNSIPYMHGAQRPKRTSVLGAKSIGGCDGSGGFADSKDGDCLDGD